MKIISIYTNKGGVGKTTISVNVSLRLSQLGYKTLLMDLDSQADASDFFNIGEDKDNLYDYLKNRIPLRQIVHSINENLSIISTADPLSINRILGRKDKYFLKEIIDEFKEFDYVVCDCSPTFSETNNQALDAADCILIPVILESRSIKAIQRNFNYFNDYDIDKNKVKLIIPNMMQNNNVHKDTLELMKEAFPDQITSPIPERVIIPRYEVLKKSIFTSDDYDVKQAFKDIVNQILERC